MSWYQRTEETALMLVSKSFTCRGNVGIVQMQVRMFSRIDGETCERVVTNVQTFFLRRITVCS
jgi:hypothetical protein